VKRRSEQPSLFDFDAGCPAEFDPQNIGGLGETMPSPASIWQEVPQARYDSWPLAMQLAYCAARDENSAKYADSDEWREFYQERAESYRSAIGSETVALHGSATDPS
jgi:hypothetical protein